MENSGLKLIKNKYIMKFIETAKKLPSPESLKGSSGTYYLIFVEGFGHCLAMYLKNERGETGWYTSYVSMIIRNVILWTEIEKL